MGKYKKVLPSSVKIPRSSQGTPAMGTDILKLSQHSRVDLHSERTSNPTYPLLVISSLQLISCQRENGPDRAFWPEIDLM